MTKEKKIKEAWGGFYTNKITDDGWMNINPRSYSDNELFDRLVFNKERHSIRPKSLQGIENNNGWIRIESEDDLPKESSNYWVMQSDKRIQTIKEYFDNKEYYNITATHYQPIIKLQPPIY